MELGPEPKYEIYATEQDIKIYGDLTIEEAFDFLNYFEKKGFNVITSGQQNSTLHFSHSNNEKSTQVKEDANCIFELIEMKNKLLKLEQQNKELRDLIKILTKKDEQEQEV